MKVRNGGAEAMTFDELLDVFYAAEAKGTDRDALKAVVAALRAHFAEPGNVSDRMVHAFIVEEQDKRGSTEVDCLNAGIAAAMSAALEELEPRAVNAVIEGEDA